MDLLSGYERKGNKIVKRSNIPPATRSTVRNPSLFLSIRREEKTQHRKYTVELELKFHQAVEPSF